MAAEGRSGLAMVCSFDNSQHLRSESSGLNLLITTFQLTTTSSGVVVVPRHAQDSIETHAKKTLRTVGFFDCGMSRDSPSDRADAISMRRPRVGIYNASAAAEPDTEADAEAEAEADADADACGRGGEARWGARTRAAAACYQRG